MTRPFQVLHVCTGNLCRSPLAEHLLRTGLQDRLSEQSDHFAVGSAGTHGCTGDPMAPFALQVLGDRNVDGSAFRTRELTAGLIRDAGLSGASAPERARALVPVLAQLRRPAARPDRDDLPDPYRGPRKGFEACARTVAESLQVLLDLWAPAGRS